MFNKKILQVQVAKHKSLKDIIEKFIAIYVFVDDILIEIGHEAPVNRNATDYEIITVALIAANYFHGNIDHAISFAKSTNLCPCMLGKSRFNRSIHSIFELIMDLFSNIAELMKKNKHII